MRISDWSSDVCSSDLALPALRAQDARIAVAEADVRLARADKRPDWKVGVTYGRRDPMYGDMASVGVSIDLPLFAGKRQNPRTAASERSEERRVGKACGSTCRYRWSPYH